MLWYRCRDVHSARESDTIVVCFNICVQTPWKWQSSSKTCRNNLITLLFYIYYMCIHWFYESSVTMHGMNNVKTHLIYCVIELVHPVISHHIAVFIMSIHSFQPLTVPRGGSYYRIFLLLLSWTSQLSQEVPAVAGILCKKSYHAQQNNKRKTLHTTVQQNLLFIYLWAYTSYLTAEALGVECCILYLLTYGGMLVACMIYEVWRCSRSRLYMKHVYSSILPAQKNAITMKTYYLPICGHLKKMKCCVRVTSTCLFSKVNDGFYIIHFGTVKTV